MIGKKFGRWFVLSQSESGKGGRRRYKCQCDCGTVRIVSKSNLKCGESKSCGCYRDDTAAMRNKTHDKSGTIEYSTWQGIKTRCLNENSKDYKRYGGRGITICEEWENSFETFYSDMGNKPNGMQIDRINNDGNYESKNCRWVTPKENSCNRSVSMTWFVNGLSFASANNAGEYFNVSDTEIRRWCTRRYEKGVQIKPQNYLCFVDDAI